MTGGTAVSRAVVAPRALARALRHPIRRGVLAVVLERDRPVPPVELASAVDRRRATFEADGARTESGRSLRSAMFHRHLPILAGVDLVTRTEAGVTPGDHRLLSSPGFDVATLRRDGADWQALGAVFGQPRRRVAVSVLSSADVPVPVAALARAVAAERAGDLSPDAPVVDDLTVRLHHVDLPILRDAEVLAYDADARRVTDVGDPDLPIPVPGV